MMFGRKTIENNNYYLLSVYKNGVLYCGSYNRDSNSGIETITSINTGEVFYSLKDFTQSILGFSSRLEWYECCFFNEERKTWLQLNFLIDEER